MTRREYYKKIAAKKKDGEKRELEASTLKSLKEASDAFAQRKREYLDAAKEAYKNAEEHLYANNLALIKNILFQKAQVDEMITNYKMARDMRQMGTVRADFARSLNSVMRDVEKTCRNMRLGATERRFSNGMFFSAKTTHRMQELLRNNGVTFADYASDVATVTDTELKNIIENEIKKDTDAVNAKMDAFESSLTQTPKAAKTVSPVALGKGAGAARVAQTATPKPTAKGVPVPPSTAKGAPQKREEEKERTPEDFVLDGGEVREYTFNWEDIPSITFDDIAGLQDVKDEVMRSVIDPIKNPELYESYRQEAGGGLLLYGPPGTGKTAIASAIAHEIGAKFCSIKSSDILSTGLGNPEKKLKTLFAEARSLPCAVIFFDEFDHITSKSTCATHAKQLRAEFLAQIQGTEAYGKQNNNILFLIGATNHPWDVDPAFLRHGRFGVRAYIGLPDAQARHYLLTRQLSSIPDKSVKISEEVNIDDIVARTEGYSGADIVGLLKAVKASSIDRAKRTGDKLITPEDFEWGFKIYKPSIHRQSIEKIREWEQSLR